MNEIKITGKQKFLGLEIPVVLGGFGEGKFQCRYLDGMKANEVGEVVGYTKGRISQIIKKYLKD